MFLDQEFFAGIQDTGEGARLTNKALIEAMSNAASLHGAMIGQSGLDNEKVGLAWMVLNWKLEVLPGTQRPLACETYTVRTWARSYSKAFALRDFQAFDANGTLFARASSKWSMVNRDDRSMVKLTPELMDCYGIEPEPAFPPEQDKFDRMRIKVPATREATFSITKPMIDCNQHVHNSSYLDLVREALPDAIDQRLFNQLEIAYRHEIAPGSTVNLSYASLAEKDGDLVAAEDPTIATAHFVTIESLAENGEAPLLHATALMR